MCALSLPGTVRALGLGDINVNSALEMQKALDQPSQAASVFVATAAVADWRPANASDQKIKKDTHLRQTMASSQIQSR